jgi:hypothetical protein
VLPVDVAFLWGLQWPAGMADASCFEVGTAHLSPLPVALDLLIRESRMVL